MFLTPLPYQLPFYGIGPSYGNDDVPHLGGLQMLFFFEALRRAGHSHKSLKQFAVHLSVPVPMAVILHVLVCFPFRLKWYDCFILKFFLELYKPMDCS
jgi:hypothetical protein